ncbi:MAG: hypothetical protein KatS3mg121_1016 [Gammaproteobacteria bacterium]|nr:MAG: hypothetical protein KatS3mg121_1016 [Gammaproteobacteria bacterium]
MTEATVLRLPRALVQRLLAHAQSEPEREVCGLIGARGGRAASLYPLRNAAPDPERAFLLDPAGQIAAQKTMRARGETLLAVYHSHPQAAAEPSTRDLDEARHAGVLMLIVSLGTRGVLELRAWRPGPDGAEPVAVELAD